MMQKHNWTKPSLPTCFAYQRNIRKSSANF